MHGRLGRTTLVGECGKLRNRPLPGSRKPLSQHIKRRPCLLPRNQPAPYLQLAAFPTFASCNSKPVNWRGLPMVPRHARRLAAARWRRARRPVHPHGNGRIGLFRQAPARCYPVLPVKRAPCGGMAIAPRRRTVRPTQCHHKARRPCQHKAPHAHPLRAPR